MKRLALVINLMDVLGYHIWPTTDESVKPIKKKRKIHIPKWLRNVAISVGVLLVLLMIGGTLYTWLTDQQAVKDPLMSTNTQTVSSQSVKPVAPAANEAEGVAVAMLTSPVPRGQDVSLTIDTNAGSTCNILVTYNKVVSKGRRSWPGDSR